MTDIDQLRLKFTGSLRPMGVLWQQIAQDTLWQYGITTSCGSAMLFIGRLGEGISQSELADALTIEPASMVRIIDQLSEAGLVRREKSPLDRRVKTLWFTETGRDTIAQIEAQLVQLRARVFADISQADLEATLRVFKVLDQAAAQLPAKAGRKENDHDHAAR